MMKPPVICQCGQPMESGLACTILQMRGESRLPCTPAEAPYGYCHDCLVQPGQLHHVGCDMERCPVCGDQAISCDCTGGEIGGNLS